ncbi:MAG: nucleotide sugar dehydrogenase [Xenococcaceae cyanobacterium]
MNSDLCYDVIIIGGFGHVGLPLGIVLADAGLHVALFDIDQNKRATIEAGEMPFIEYDAEPILRKVMGKSLHIADDLSDINRSESVIITIGTPVDEYLNPKTRPILELAEQLTGYLRHDQCLILRSTIYPGTSKCLYDFFNRRGHKIHIAYCPERIVQGYAIRELRKLPQIISGFSETAVRDAEALFSRLGVETIPVSVQEAELVKLFSNAWRYIQFAITNQFYMMATEQGADYNRIYSAMTHHYERTQDFPKPGFAAGPCLLKDTLQLAASYGNHFQLGQAAMMVNEGLPNFIVNHLRLEQKIDLTNRLVGILGMAFKADIDDIRDSLSYKLAKILRFHGALVICSDEYVKDPNFVTKEELIAKCSIVIVGVPHTAYKTLTVPEDTYLLDMWDIIQFQSASRSRI